MKRSLRGLYSPDNVINCAKHSGNGDIYGNGVVGAALHVVQDRFRLTRAFRESGKVKV